MSDVCDHGSTAKDDGQEQGGNVCEAAGCNKEKQASKKNKVKRFCKGCFDKACKGVVTMKDGEKKTFARSVAAHMATAEATPTVVAEVAEVVSADGAVFKADFTSEQFHVMQAILEGGTLKRKRDESLSEKFDALAERTNNRG